MRGTMSDQKPSVLFLSSYDSVRSQMAAALLRHRAGNRFEVHSAGLTPRDVHPLTRTVLEEAGIETSSLEPTRISRFLARVVVNTAIIVCEQGPGCPRMYPFATETLHGPFEDPRLPDMSDAERLRAFRSLRDRIDMRIRSWSEARGGVSEPTNALARPPRAALQPGL